MDVNCNLSNNATLRFYEMRSRWSQIHQSFTPMLRLRTSTCSPDFTEVQTLVQKLTQLENIGRVRAVTPKAGDLHWIEFELEPQLGTQISDKTWEQAENLVIDCEWKLRNETDEKWYFYTQIITQFFRWSSRGPIAAASYPQSLETHQKIQSIFASFTVPVSAPYAYSA